MMSPCFRFGLGRRAVRSHFTHQRAVRVLRVEGLRKRRGHVLRQDSDIAVLHFAVGHNLVHIVAGHVDRDREADTLIAARIAGQNRRVDADQVAFVVHQRAAGIAWVNRRIGLDEVFHLLDAKSAAADGAHDSLVTVWPTPNGSPMASTTSPTSTLLESPSVSAGKVRAVDLDDCDIGPRVRADHARLEFALVVQRHHNRRRSVYHMVIGQDVAFRADNHARAQRLFGPFTWHPGPRPVAVSALIPAALISEELTEERFQPLRDLALSLLVAALKTRLLLHYLRCRDVDDGGYNPLHDGRVSSSGGRFRACRDFHSRRLMPEETSGGAINRCRCQGSAEEDRGEPLPAPEEL